MCLSRGDEAEQDTLHVFIIFETIVKDTLPKLVRIALLNCFAAGCVHSCQGKGRTEIPAAEFGDVSEVADFGEDFWGALGRIEGFQQSFLFAC